MANLDLVITSDTATAHLAGGLGVPVWVALCAAPDWRWRRTARESPWYPSMRLFRQRTLFRWDEVFEEMAAAIAEMRPV
jgi:ADP-heptose:LPS heptosyltransferase